MLLAGEILKKLKMFKNVKNWGNHACVLMPICTNIVAPIFNIFNVFRISPAGSTFSNKFLTFPQPEAHSIFFFNFSPARSTFHFLFLTFPQPEAHPETQFLTFLKPEAHPKMQFLTFPQSGEIPQKMGAPNPLF